MDLSRKINIIGDIDEVAYQDFVEKMDELDEILEGDDIYIELSSHGGDAMMALAFFDRIRNSKSTVHIKAIGLVASAAVLILAAGDKRSMTKNAWVMVHEDTTTANKHMKVTEIEKTANISRRLETQWDKLLESRTKTDAAEWDYLHMNETYLDSKECLKLGLIEEVL